MGLPRIRITFLEAAKTAYIRSERGVVGLILRENVVPEENPILITNAKDIPDGISAANEKQIRKALIGYLQNVNKLYVYIIPSLGQTTYTYTVAEVGEEANPAQEGWYIKNGNGVYVLSTDTEADPAKTYYVRDEIVEDEASISQYEDALNRFVQLRVNYLAIPTVETEGMTAEIATWIKDLHSDIDENSPLVAVLPNSKANSEYIINYTTESVTDEEGDVFNAEGYCSRIAGLVATTPLTRSCSFVPLPELTDCTFHSRKELDAKIDAGQFVVFYDGSKVKTGRAVNSLTTTTDAKSKVYKKIRVVDIMCMIKADIAKAAQDSYIGKYTNSYDNKMLLVGAINTYFDEMKTQGALGGDNNYAEIDVDAAREYLKEKGVDVSELTADDIAKANTDDQVFLRALISILDAMEDITLEITI